MSVTSNELKLAIVQMSSNDNLDDNFSILQKAIDECGSQSEVICFPENCTYLRIDMQEKQDGFITVFDDRFQKLQPSIDKYGLTVLLGGVPINDGGEFFNATVVMRPMNMPVIAYRKLHLFDVSVGGKDIRESDIYSPGPSLSFAEINGWKSGFSICYDIRFPEIYLSYAKQGVEIIFVPSAFLTQTGEAHWESLLRARAIESQCYVVAPAQAGQHNSTKGDKVRNSHGHSMVVDPWGKVLVDLGRSEFDIKHVVLEKGQIEKVRSQIPMHSHRRIR